MVLQSNKGISNFMVAIDKIGKNIMALIPLVMINGTIKKYENKEKHKIYVETLTGKKPWADKKASLSIRERITKCST